MTIEYGDDFHLYEECFERDNVWLELENVQASVSTNPNFVKIGIPIKIWRKIIKGWSENPWGGDESLDNRSYDE